MFTSIHVDIETRIIRGWHDNHAEIDARQRGLPRNRLRIPSAAGDRLGSRDSFDVEDVHFAQAN